MYTAEKIHRRQWTGIFTKIKRNEVLLGIGAGVTGVGMYAFYNDKYSKYSDGELLNEYYKLQTSHNNDELDVDDEMKLDIVKQIMKKRNLF